MVVGIFPKLLVFLQQGVVASCCFYGIMKSKDKSSISGDSPLPIAFREIRTKMNLSQDDFARLLGVKQNSVGRWERGETTPVFKISQIKKLISVLEQAGIPLNELPDEN